MTLLRVEEQEFRNEQDEDASVDVADDEERDWRRDVPAFSPERQTTRALALARMRGN